MAKRTVVLVCCGMMLLILMGYPNSSIAEVSVNIGINVPLPPLVIPAPPPVVVIPKTYVYYAPSVDVDIFFHHGYWYRPHHGHWYQARGYNGPWAYIAPQKVPGVLFGLPPDFRHSPSRHQYIAHEQLKKNWNTWEREKHWDKHNRYAHERSEIRDGEHREAKHHRDRGKKHDRD